MAVTASPFGLSFRHLGRARMDFGSHTFRCLLTTSSYVPSFDADEWASDITDEISGTGYTAGGATLSGLAWTYSATDNWCALTCTAPVWTGATFTARRAVIYRDTGTASTSPLLSWVDFGANASPAAVDFTITFGTDGIYRLATA